MNIPRMHESVLADGTKVRLHRWLSRQVANFHENKLKIDRQVRLQELVNLGKISWELIPESHWTRSPSEDAQVYASSLQLPADASKEEIMAHALLAQSQGIAGHSQRLASSMKMSSDESSDNDNDNDIEPFDEYHVDALMHVTASGNEV
jgi:hypothetical protein